MNSKLKELSLLIRTRSEIPIKRPTAKEAAMTKKHMLDGREYKITGVSARSCADLDGRGVFIERSWGRVGAVFSWTVNSAWYVRYASGQAASWEAAAADAHVALSMMEQGQPPPPPKFVAKPARR